MNRPKIAHCIYSYLPATQNWIYTQLTANPACDHAVISCGEEHPEQFPWEPRYVAFPPVSLHNRLRLLLARYWIVQPHRFLHASIAGAQPDIVHGHFSTESWRILSATRSAHLPLITTFYGLDVNKLARRRMWKRRYPELFSYGSRCIVEGPHMAGQLHAIGCPEEKIAVIALGVDGELYRAAVDKTAADMPGIPDNRVMVLFTGLSREKKGPLDAAAVFCAAAREQPELELHIIGDGCYRSRLDRLFRAAGMRERVIFHGAVPVKRYRKILASADLLLAPSCHAADGDTEGGAPVVCIEAQAAGKPVVATRHCDIPFVVKHGETGLLSDEHDISSMARDLCTLAGDVHRRKTMGIAGIRHVAEQHDHLHQGRKIAKLYHDVIGESSSNGRAV